MVIVKLFGLLDLYSALVMLLVQFDVIKWRMILTATAWLLLKGYMFRGDIASGIDMGIGFYHIIMVIMPIPLITWVLAIYLFLKGLQSLVF
jgi:hypothetical protein